MGHMTDAEKEIWKRMIHGEAVQGRMAQGNIPQGSTQVQGYQGSMPMRQQGKIVQRAGYQNPYSKNEIQDPYHNLYQSNGIQNPYQNPHQGNGIQNPYQTNGIQNPRPNERQMPPTLNRNEYHPESMVAGSTGVYRDMQGGSHFTHFDCGHEYNDSVIRESLPEEMTKAEKIRAFLKNREMLQNAVVMGEIMNRRGRHTK